MSLIQGSVLGAMGIIVVASLLYFWIDLWKLKASIDSVSKNENKQREAVKHSGNRKAEGAKSKNKLRVIK